jgi:hypothetical protein
VGFVVLLPCLVMFDCLAFYAFALRWFAI